MDKIQHEPIPVYIITRTGVGFNDEGIQAVCDLIFSEEGRSAGPFSKSDESATGILAFTGRHLLDPAVLADALREKPNARVVLSANQNGDLVLYGYGPDEMGLPGVIRVLENNPGTSWESLMLAAGYEEDVRNGQ